MGAVVAKSNGKVDSAISLTKTFQPGPIGMDIDLDSGRVLKVHPGTQAGRMDVQVGMIMEMIQGRPYNAELLQKHISGQSPYGIIFKKEGEVVLLTSTFKPGPLG